MKKRLFFFCLLLAAIIVPGCSKGEADEYAMITFMIGDVKKNNAEAQIGDIIKQDDAIATGADSFCDVRIGDSIIRVKALTNVTISTLVKSGDIENTVLGLDTGKILCKPKKLIKTENFIVKTPTAVAGVRGTQFAVESDKNLTTRIKVFKGEVKVVKRVKQLESNVEQVLDYAPALEKEEKVVITADDVRDAEKIVDQVIKDETGNEKNAGDVMEKVIARTKNDVIINDDKIEKFKAEDFIKDNKEIIEIEQKSRDEVRRISIVVKQEKEMPVPEGRLLVTRFDVYFIKNGKVVWDGKVIGEPFRKGDKLFIAAGEYVFCAMSDGPVIWKTPVSNDGKIDVKGGKVVINSDGRQLLLDEENGKKL